MKAYLNAILFFAFLSASGFAVRFLLLSDVVPVSEGDQSSGRVLAAFILRSIENTGWFGLLITVLFGLVWPLPAMSNVRFANGRTGSD